MKKRYLLLVPLFALMLVGCSDNNVEEIPDIVDPEPDETDDPIVDNEALIASTLEALTSTDFAQVGTLEVYAGTSEGSYGSTTIDIESVWDGEFFYLQHTYLEDDGSTSTANTKVYKDDEGLAVSRYLNYDNTYLDYPLYDDAGNLVYFDVEYINPFSYFISEDLTVLEDGTISASIDESYSLLFSYFLTAYEDIPLDTILFTVSDEGTISGKVEFYEEYESEESEFTYSGGVYEFEIVDPSTIDSGKVEQLELLEGHEPLTELFTSLQAQNYSMSVHRSTNLYGDSNYETIETSNAALRTFDVGEEIKSYSGYYQDENGLHSVISNGNLLEATDYPTTLYDISLERSNFLLSPAFFDIEDENTFVLKEDYQSFVFYGAPDFRYSWDFLLSSVAGSYKIVINDDDSVNISYSYSYYDYGNLIEGTVEITLTNIGTTSIDNFTFVPYEEPDIQTWDDFGEDVTSLLTKYLDNKYNEILPLLDYSQYGGTFEEMTSGYARLFISDSSYGGETIVEEYRAQLESIGWRLVEDKDDYTYIYPTDDGNGYYHLRIYSMTNGRYVYLNIFGKGTDLATYLNNKYGSSINSTVTITEIETYYDANGEVYSGPNTETSTYQFTDEAVLKTDENNLTYYVSNEDGSFAVYSYSYYYDEWSLWRSYNSSYGYTISSYDGYGTYNPTGLAAFASYLNYISGSDGEYQVLDAALSLVAQYVFDVSTYNSQYVTEGSLSIDYYNNQFVISVTLEIPSGNYIRELVYTATYSRFGITSISNSNLPDLESLA